MEVTFLQKHLNKAEESTFVDYVNQKLRTIENLLTKFAEDAALLKVSIRKFDKHDAYEVEFCLTLPTKSLVATEASHQISKAVDLSIDRLIAQIKKHMDALRGTRSHKSIRNTKTRVLSPFEISEEVL